MKLRLFIDLNESSRPVASEHYSFSLIARMLNALPVSYDSVAVLLFDYLSETASKAQNRLL